MEMTICVNWRKVIFEKIKDTSPRSFLIDNARLGQGSDLAKVPKCVIKYAKFSGGPFSSVCEEDNPPKSLKNGLK